MSFPREGEAVSPAEFQDFVLASWRGDEGSSEQATVLWGRLLEDEGLEFLVQHGPGALLLMSHELGGKAYAERYPGLAQNMADELSDLLWFDFKAAHDIGVTPGQLVANRLGEFTGRETPTFDSFEEWQSSVLTHADKVKVLSKYGLQHPETPHTVALSDSPLYLFMRTHIHLVRALKGEVSGQAGPPTASDMEPTQPIDQALGNHLIILTYIAKDRLDLDIGDIARYNMYKLTHRELFGKTVGHLFGSDE